MLVFNGKLYNMHFDEAKYRKTLQEALETQLRQAARAWLRAVIPLVPVYTGMARGTLQPLGRILRVAVPISPRVTRPYGNPSSGAAKSSFDFSTNGWTYNFQWTNDVLHYIINEFNDVSASVPNLINETPWHSIAAGNKAFDAYLAENLPKRIPNWGEHISFSAITVR